MQNAIYQNRLALDFLLAEEVCGKFNLTNCCVQIDDQGQVVENFLKKMTKLAHVPVQVWPNSLFWGSFSALGGFKTLIGVLLLLGMWLVGLCLLPLLVNSLKSMVEAIVQQ